MGEIETETTVDSTETEKNAANPFVQSTRHSLPLILFVFEMMDDATDRLEGQNSDNNASEDGMAVSCPL